jgi:hypothetical protein
MPKEPLVSRTGWNTLRNSIPLSPPKHVFDWRLEILVVDLHRFFKCVYQARSVFFGRRKTWGTPILLNLLFTGPC